jgi:hypothetical protein
LLKIVRLKETRPVGLGLTDGAELRAGSEIQGGVAMVLEIVTYGRSGYGGDCWEGRNNIAFKFSTSTRADIKYSPALARKVEGIPTTDLFNHRRSNRIVSAS